MQTRHDSPWSSAAAPAPARERGSPRFARGGGRRAGPSPLRLAPRPAGGREEWNGRTLGSPITDPADPRWVLAIRTAEELEGAVLRPERREVLIRMGQTMGLSLFDANLVIAIIQDQARRGYGPEYCATAGEPQLRMVPIGAEGWGGAAGRRRRAVWVAAMVAAVLAAEAMVLLGVFA